MIASFEVEVNGRSRTIGVERIGAADAGRYHVIVDGRRRVVDVRRAAGGRLSLMFPEEQGASYDVAVTAATPADVVIHLPAGAIHASLDGRRSRGAGHTRGPGLGGEQRIAAPMSGRVVRVLVTPGEEVAPRQPLVVVEAMKMENELSAARAGRVKEVPVREGASVEAGRLLVVIA